MNKIYGAYLNHIQTFATVSVPIQSPHNRTHYSIVIIILFMPNETNCRIRYTVADTFQSILF